MEITPELSDTKLTLSGGASIVLKKAAQDRPDAFVLRKIILSKLYFTKRKIESSVFLRLFEQFCHFANKFYEIIYDQSGGHTQLIPLKVARKSQNLITLCSLNHTAQRDLNVLESTHLPRASFYGQKNGARNFAFILKNYRGGDFIFMNFPIVSLLSKEAVTNSM